MKDTPKVLMKEFEKIPKTGNIKEYEELKQIWIRYKELPQSKEFEHPSFESVDMYFNIRQVDENQLCDGNYLARIFMKKVIWAACVPKWRRWYYL